LNSQRDPGCEVDETPRLDAAARAARARRVAASPGTSTSATTRAVSNAASRRDYIRQVTRVSTGNSNGEALPPTSARVKLARDAESGWSKRESHMRRMFGR
jgi:hypothetical protein